MANALHLSHYTCHLDAIVHCPLNFEDEVARFGCMNE